MHAFERAALPIPAIVSLLATAFTFGVAPPARSPVAAGLAGFLLTVGASFGYAAGWNPYATDHTRYPAGWRR